MRSGGRQTPEHEAESSQCTPRIRWFPAAIHSLCSIYGICQSKRRCAPPPSAGATLGKCAAGQDGESNPSSIRRSHGPTAPTGRHRRHQPRSAPTTGNLPASLLHDRPGAIPVLDISRVHRHRQQQSQGVYYAICRFRPGDLLAGIVASEPPFSVVFTLWLSMMAAPSTSSGGRGVSALGLPHHGTQRLMDPFPGSILRPAAEVLVQGLPGRQIVRNHPPGTAGAQQVQNAVDYLPQVHGPGPSSGLG